IRDNVISKIGRTGIRLIETENMQISGNYLSDILGVHGNGISIYLKNSNILIADNVIENVPFAFTYHGTGNVDEATNMWLLNNVLMGWVRSWGSAFDNAYFLHNLIFASGDQGKAIQIPNSEPNTTIVNNVIDGLVAKQPFNGWTLSHNVYSSLAWTQSGKYGWKLEAGGDIREKIGSFMENSAATAVNNILRDLPEGKGIYELLPTRIFKEYDFQYWKSA